eukprot:NODE_349_length_8994_cov_1.235526.p6 type:complete len:240 gc:universal NODE_349_length_8994_cov_1.235526:1325-2044(+)
MSLPEEINQMILRWLPFHLQIDLENAAYADDSRNRCQLKFFCTETIDFLTFEFSLSFYKRKYIIEYKNYYDDQLVLENTWTKVSKESCIEFFNQQDFKNFQGQFLLKAEDSTLVFSSRNILHGLNFFHSLEYLGLRGGCWKLCKFLNKTSFASMQKRASFSNYLAINYNHSTYFVGICHTNGFCRELAISKYENLAFLVFDFFLDKIVEVFIENEIQIDINSINEASLTSRKEAVIFYL